MSVREQDMNLFFYYSVNYLCFYTLIELSVIQFLIFVLDLKFYNYWSIYSAFVYRNLRTLN